MSRVPLIGLSNQLDIRGVHCCLHSYKLPLTLTVGKTMAVSRAKVILAEYLSPTIRWFRLQTLEPLPSRFYAGQWLDLHIPMTDRVVVTGYSMCSSPQQFLKSGQLDLAVKRSDDSAASWMHDEV
ncbi:OXNAD1 [Bugula neritina]|uniref:OXNAD1 n=1 Tax=Bugula neritina TaxID=10212 RepID=A0A7J7JCL9_BUGNE|nr:OXNAD1 [Bugula neritina]